MIRTLLKLRWRSLFASMTAKNKRSGKKSGKGYLLLYLFLFLYLAVVVGGATVTLFATLIPVYHGLSLDWLYFSIAGLLAFGISLIGNVFATQSQLYDAKDNSLLLSMPIPPGMILLTRMIPLLAMNLLFSALVIVPAICVYAVMVSFSILNVLCQLLTLLGVCVLSQAFACFLGWLLHMALRKLNKSVASVLYVIVFFAIYFFFMRNAQNVLNAMTAGASALAHIFSSWGWPLYAMGCGMLGRPLYLLAFLLLCAVCFAVVYGVLSVTFIRTATATAKSRRQRRVSANKAGKVVSPVRAVVIKESRKFLSSPVYLTNNGLGVLFTVALPIIAVFLRGRILPVVAQFGFEPYLPIGICVFMFGVLCMCAISTPSVSLEGKSIWILKSMPIGGKQILQGKLIFHAAVVAPAALLSGIALPVLFGCNAVNCIAVAVSGVLFSVMTDLLGMLFGLKWAKLDFLSDAYPCKQSVSMFFSLFVPLLIPLAMGAGYLFLHLFLSVESYLAIWAVILAGISFVLYRAVMGWGVRKWDSL